MTTPSDMNEWERCITHVQLETGQLCFCSKQLVKEGSAISKTDDGEGNLSASFPSKTCFEFVVTNESVPGVDIFYRNARNALELSKLSKTLKANKGLRTLPCYTCAPRDGEQSCRKGFLVHSLQPSSTNETQDFVEAVAREFEQAVYIKYEVDEDTIYKKVISLKPGEEETKCTLVETSPPGHSRILDAPATHAVFQSKTKVEKILSKELRLKEVDELWRIASPLFGSDEDRTAALQAKNPVIVIEGLDGVGKTTLCGNLSKAINAQLLGSPPKCLMDLRSTFDNHPPIVRRAYYSLGNYLVAKEMTKAAETSPVVIDRFWYSTAAYAIVTEIGSGGLSQLPKADHPIYQWPHDLLKPDIVVLLVVSPEVRSDRIHNRGERMTEEEKLIEQIDLQKRLLETYKRMQDPKVQIVDASGSPEQVLQEVVDLLRSKGLLNDEHLGRVPS